MNDHGSQIQEPSDARVVGEYLGHCLPMRWVWLMGTVADAPAAARMQGILFGEDGTLQDLTRPGLREQVIEAVMEFPVLQQGLLREARDFRRFRDGFKGGQPSARDVELFMLDMDYRLLRRRGALIGLGMRRASPDQRHEASLIEYRRPTRFPLWRHVYLFVVHDMATGSPVVRIQEWVKPLLRPWKESFYKDVSLAWSSDSRHVRFGVGRRLRQTFSLACPEEVSRATWVDDHESLKAFFEPVSWH